MSLTPETRKALPDDDFAVPVKRALPIHDADHVRMAWSQIDNTKGLSDAERAEARANILRKAKELGIDTADWTKAKVAAMRFEAMSLEVPDLPDHPNRVPFSGVLTRIDEASDNPVGGAKGKHVLIPKAVAESALSSLLGMGVDYTPNLDGHNAQKKIGIITAATIEGDGIHIEGFLYGADFPAVVADIQARTSLLGFSYEAQAAVANWNHDPVEVTSCVFTGAAILLKDKAAYTSTSLAASAEDNEMDMNELIAAMTKVVDEKVAPLVADVAAMKANAEKLEASSVAHKVKPHSDALRAAADGMEKDGFGLHAKRGHVAHLRRMADKMDADAVMGKLPHILDDEGWFSASADAASNPAVEALTAKVAELEGKLFANAQAPARKTAEAAAAEKAAMEAAGNTVDFKRLDAELKASGASEHKRMSAITAARWGIK